MAVAASEGWSTLCTAREVAALDFGISVHSVTCLHDVYYVRVCITFPLVAWPMSVWWGRHHASIIYDQQWNSITSQDHLNLSRSYILRQAIGAFVYHDLRKSNDVVVILVQGQWSHRPPLIINVPEAGQ